MYPHPCKYKSEHFKIEGTSKEEVEEKIIQLYNDLIINHGKENVKILKKIHIPIKDKNEKTVKYVIEGSFIITKDIEIHNHKHNIKIVKPNFNLDLTNLDRKIY